MLSECWRQVKTGDVAASERNALVGGPFGSNLVSRDYVDHGIPVIRGQNMGDRWVGGGFVYVTPDKADSLSANLARPGDIVFTQRGTLGQVALVPPNPSGCYLISQSQMKLTVDRRIADSLFLYYQFRSPEQLEYVRRNAIQTGVPHTNLGILRDTPIILPPLIEQQAIACILGALDDKIELSRRMSQTLEGIARAIFKSWFVDFDPVWAKRRGEPLCSPLAPDIADLFPDAFEDSELGEIPKGWRDGAIKDCCIRIQNGGTPRRSEPLYWEPATIPWLTSGEVRQTIVVETENRISEIGFENSSAKWLPAGSTVVALYGATAGQVSYIAQALTTNQAICGLIPKHNYRYFNYLQLANSVHALANLARGSAQQNISKGIVEATRVVLPDENVLRAFDAALDPVVKKWVANLRANITLAVLRDTLLPRLISGELRVPDAERIVGRCV